MEVPLVPQLVLATRSPLCALREGAVMPRFDFKCPDCGLVRYDVWISGYRDSQGLRTADIAPCEFCGGILEKQPAAPNFSVSGFNAKNGYSR